MSRRIVPRDVPMIKEVERGRKKIILRRLAHKKKRKKLELLYFEVGFTVY